MSTKYIEILIQQTSEEAQCGLAVVGIQTDYYRHATYIIALIKEI